jgi:hypothetical protein
MAPLPRGYRPDDVFQRRLAWIVKASSGIRSLPAATRHDGARGFQDDGDKFSAPRQRSPLWRLSVEAIFEF